MDGEVEGFSDTGLIVFVATMGSLVVVIVVVALLTALFARRHRMLKGCGVLLGGPVIAAPIVILAAVIATVI